MRAELSNMKAQYANLTKEEREAAKAQGGLLEQMAKLNAELKTEEQAYGDFQRDVGNYEKANISLRGELKNLVGQLTEMKFAGQENTVEFQKLKEKAAEIKSAMTNVSQEINIASSSTSKLQGAIEQLNAGIAVFTAGANAMKLLGTSNNLFWHF